MKRGADGEQWNGKGGKSRAFAQGSMNGIRVIENYKIFAEVLKGNSSVNAKEVKEAFKLFIFNLKKEDKKKYKKARVGVTRIPGLAYGVGKSLIKEGIFLVHATSLGPNLCLLEESVEGDLDLLLKNGGE